MGFIKHMGVHIFYQYMWDTKWMSNAVISTKQLMAINITLHAIRKPIVGGTDGGK